MEEGWLYQQGFAFGDLRSEIGTPSFMRMHPMVRSCYKGELEVCKWLYENGAAEYITKANNGGITPMLWACAEGHLPIEVGAVRDITRGDKRGVTPMWIACQEGHLALCKWMLEVGAAEDITAGRPCSSLPSEAICRCVSGSSK